MKLKFSKKYIEPAINIALWLIILVVALFLGQPDDNFIWQAGVKNLIWLLPFFIIFIVNNLILAPQLLFKKKYIAYFVVCFTLIISVSHPIITRFLHDSISINRTNIESQSQQPMIPPPIQQRQRPMLRQGMMRVQRPESNGLLPKMMSNFLIGFLVIGFNTAIKQTGKLVKEEKLRHALEEEKLQAELSFLKHQISPHFLMNTLNNIHALIDLDSKNAQESIIKLSSMLRYLLYEKDDEKTELSREVDFIKSYVGLMKMRYSDKLDVQISISQNLPNIDVPPFVFVTIIENAFKYGALPNKYGFIHVSIGLSDKHLVFTCSNSKQMEIINNKDEKHGIGLENTRKRLNLFYDENYRWSICDKEDTYVSIIKIPVYEA